MRDVSAPEKDMEGGLDTPARRGEGFRFTYSCNASRDHVSRDLKEYLFEMRAMSMRRVRSAEAEYTARRSGGLWVCI